MENYDPNKYVDSIGPKILSMRVSHLLLTLRKKFSLSFLQFLPRFLQFVFAVCFELIQLFWRYNDVTSDGRGVAGFSHWRLTGLRPRPAVIFKRGIQKFEQLTAERSVNTSKCKQHERNVNSQ